jgi:adenylate kinase family enzyme
MKIHLFGASGAGVTTLGVALAAALEIPYFDSDNYFWGPSDAPFTVRRPEGERNALLAHDLAQGPNWVVGGSLMGWGPWGEQQLAALDLAVFLWLPPALRLQRLRQREHARYGDVITTDPARAAQTEAFLTWAAGYDDGSCGGSRTLANHTAWLGRFTCPVLALRGNFTVAERQAHVLAEVARLGVR